MGCLLSNILFAMGVLFLLAAATYAGYALLNTWLMGQDRYLSSHDIAPLSVPAMTWTPSPTPTATPLPTLTPTPTPTATPTPPSPPVQIRVPAIGVTRSIIKLPRVRDRRTEAWTWNTKQLFRSGRSDLVGHWEGSAYPGQEGNMILVGHNYGYGYSGVFVRLGRLKTGQKVYVVNRAGQTFTYEVKSVNRVKWRLKDFGELTQHLSFLAPAGDERVTLVSCAGADLEPFPERVYVVAAPVK
jgi:LPXTG-site transpeptidase (sortase) family protein